MKVPIRTTVNGTEYWCTDDKKTLFVPVGEQPLFEVTESPTTMLHKGETVKPLDEPVINLDGMTGTQLREFAAENNIEVPGNLKKVDAIRDYIEEQLAADAE
ncbi:hypothetical protein [Lysinibacillus sp. Ag94]|uniref:hypothetical protein n=1 Tax=Lysinibacillus sp. Ag94 TaxID=2936682 RepID=UPI00200C3C34|nr:hypothetical protein [Lysinibacillus sp. Ag94]UPW82738.1 hypothetical protein MY533_18785 [Lysinibacillus sp. Ag94]